ncbi:hypothetical protein BGZ83_005600 [Gryganskiella cystojenkinii]|nr:hypothetical protein BGZ83_005600 [Gryganskiella cystojenkinii]
MVVPRKHRTVVENTHPCGVCKTRPFQYTCPRCNLRYCSLECYKDQSHGQCTELFYKSAVMSELQSSPGATSDDRKQMLGILDRFERQAVDQEQFLNMSEDELLQHHMQQQQQQRHRQQQQPNANDADSGANNATEPRRKLTPKERDELIRKAIEQEQLENQNSTLDQNDIEEDQEEIRLALEQEYQDFVCRFSGVNLDQESFESIWARLSPEEQQEFQERFMISGKVDNEDFNSNHNKAPSDVEDESEEEEARYLLKEMEDTMQRGEAGRGHGRSDSVNPMLADLDREDLRALRDAEISELIPLWKPWWEIEAEEAGQLKKVIVSKITSSATAAEEDAQNQDPENTNRLAAAAAALGQEDNSNIPAATATTATPSSQKSAVSEQLVLDEEAMLRPQPPLIQAVNEATQESNRRTKQLPPLTRAPHPSVIYHICGLLFAYAATSRVLNGDLVEEPEQFLAHLFELCPFFAPPPSSPSLPKTSGSKKAEGGVSRSRAVPVPPPTIPEVEDFETTLAVVQQSGLSSKLWRGDTLRPEMLSLLLRDLTLLLARPSRCLKSIQELEDVFDRCLKFLEEAEMTKKRRGSFYSKSTLTRLFKKLEFYESYLLAANEWLIKTARLDQVRTEVVLTGIRVRQEMKGWVQELEQVSRVSQQSSSSTGQGSSSGSKQEKGKVFIQELD